MDQKDKSFNFVLFVIIVKSCPPIATWNGQMTDKGGLYYVGEKVNYRCTVNHIFPDGSNNSQISICGSDGQWYPSIKKCRGKLI